LRSINLITVTLKSHAITKCKKDFAWNITPFFQLTNWKSIKRSEEQPYPFKLPYNISNRSRIITSGEA
jgi:hypothetical protein